jgi:hypothetical protein
LLKLEETRTQAKRKMDQHQQTVKRWFDENYSSDQNFNIGDLVLRWDKAHEEKGEHSKFHNLWLGPFIIIEKLGPSSFHLQTLEGQPDTFLGEWPGPQKILFLTKLRSDICKYMVCCVFLFSLISLIEILYFSIFLNHHIVDPRIIVERKHYFQDLCSSSNLK